MPWRRRISKPPSELCGTVQRLPDALIRDTAAKRIQICEQSRRVRCAAAILARLPRDLKEYTIELCVQSVEMEIKVSMERIVASKFEQCGVRVSNHGDVTIAAHHDSKLCSRHLNDLRLAFDAATSGYGSITFESVRRYLLICAHYQNLLHHWSSSMESSVEAGVEAWTQCIEAMRRFARTVILAKVSPQNENAKAWLDSRHVIEAAVVCAGA